MKLLLPLSWFYALAMLLRNKAFDLGILKCERVGVPVISVGNLTVGGTGKTPFVEYIIAHLLEHKKRIAVVSRGYKRKSRGVVVVSDGTRVPSTAEEGGDEPVQIAEKFPAAIVVVGEKRVEAAKEAVELGAELIVLDDGFQHRYLKRDLDIVVMDATSDITKDAVLPAGRLREPLSGVRRANVFALSRYDEAIESMTAQRLRERFQKPVFTYRYAIKDVRRASDEALVSLDVVRRMKLLAFSGIGKHAAFMHELHKNGFAPVSDMRFSDHHDFSEGDLATIASFAKGLEAEACITTEKDIMRLRANHARARTLFDEIPVFYLTIEVELLESRDAFHSLIDSYLRTKGTNGYRNSGHVQQEV